MDVDKPFAYTSIQKVRSLGSFSALSDESVLMYIRMAAATINRITGQWFQAIGLSMRVSGKGDSMLHFPGVAPILKISSLMLSPDSSSQALDNYFIESGRRILRMKVNMPGWAWVDVRWDCDYFESVSQFPRRAGSVEVQGYFGYVNAAPTVDSYNAVVPYSTTTAIEFRNDTATLEVVSAHGVRAGSSVVIGSPVAEAIPLFVVAADQTTNVLTVDPMGDYLPSTIAAGAQVLSFGVVPPLIRRANALLAAKYINDDTASTSGSISGAATKKLIRERTEDYEYELSSPAGGDTSDSDFTTGDAEVDRILANFVIPPGVEFV